MAGNALNQRTVATLWAYLVVRLCQTPANRNTTTEKKTLCHIRSNVYYLTKAIIQHKSRFIRANQKLIDQTGQRDGWVCQSIVP